MRGVHLRRADVDACVGCANTVLQLKSATALGERAPGEARAAEAADGQLGDDSRLEIPFNAADGYAPSALSLRDPRLLPFVFRAGVARGPEDLCESWLRCGSFGRGRSRAKESRL